MKFVTPYIVIDCEDKKQVFRKVAEILDSKLMILLTRHIYPIILRILLEQDESKLRKAIEFLRSNLFGQSINELVQEKETQLTVDLAMYLGRSDTDEQVNIVF
jgi:hypothetical protein